MGPRQCVTERILAKAYVILAMHECVQLCQDPQTEFALLRESLGVSKINNILRVHGHTILHEREAPKSLVKLRKGHWKDSFQGERRTVRDKPHSVPANQVLVTKE